VIFITWQKHSALCKNAAEPTESAFSSSRYSNKKADNKDVICFFYGAGDGSWLQPIFIFIAQECLHNKDIIEQIRKFLNCKDF